ncbi:MAG: flavoprotein [Alistipes finegoldii]
MAYPALRQRRSVRAAGERLGPLRRDGRRASTVGTVGRVAAGAAQSLIERAADVMLKERRRLVFVVRETPLSLIHLRNMAALTEAGAVILPASPSFYAAPQGVEELCGTVADRAAALLGVDISRYEWGK